MNSNIDIDTLAKQVDDLIESFLVLSPEKQNVSYKANFSDKENEQSEANKLIKKNEVKNKLCIALRSAKDDIWEISKIVVTTIAPMLITGVIVITASISWVLAIASVIIARMGIEVYCHNCE